MSTQSRIDAEARKDPEILEQEIDQKRSDIGNLVDALESKLSPGQLIDQALSYAKGNGGEFFGNLGTTLKANPVPTVLTSVGLIWLMLGQNRTPAPSRHTVGLSDRLDDVGNRLQGARQQVGGAVDALEDKASRVGHGVSDSLSHTSERLSSNLHDASDALQRQGENLKGGLQHLLQEQPLALAAVGVALGAVIGAALPTTRTENRLLGETSDRLTGKARQMAAEGLEKTRAIGEELLDKVKDEDAPADRDASARGNAPQVPPGDNLSGELGRL